MLARTMQHGEEGLEPSDAALLLACRQGDAAAWEALIMRYQRLVYSVPRRAGLSDELAADVFQHVFATLLTKLDQIEQPERIGAWLVTTARREAWRVSRQERAVERHGSVDDSDAAGTIPDHDPLPDEIVLRLEQQHRVRTAVAALDDRCRTLLTLLFYSAESPPYAEIAAAIGTTEGGVGPTRARCLQKLRRLLGDPGD
jgi:RNA polymerase sigma factor (sigma-70 family)